MDGTDIIKYHKTKWIILVENDTRIVCHPNGKPLVTTDVAEAKALALTYSGRRVDLKEWLEAHNGLD